MTLSRRSGSVAGVRVAREAAATLVARAARRARSLARRRAAHGDAARARPAAPCVRRARFAWSDAVRAGRAARADSCDAREPRATITRRRARLPDGVACRRGAPRGQERRAAENHDREQPTPNERFRHCFKLSHCGYRVQDRTNPGPRAGPWPGPATPIRDFLDEFAWHAHRKATRGWPAKDFIHHFTKGFQKTIRLCAGTERDKATRGSCRAKTGTTEPSACLYRGVASGCLASSEPVRHRIALG